MIYKNNLFILMVIHSVLAVLFLKMPILATLLSAAVLVYGLRSIIRNNISSLIIAIGYLSVLGVVLRVLKAGIFWEYDKYAIILLTSVFLLKNPKYIVKNIRYLIFILLLIPGMILVNFAFFPMSQYISGPVMLGLTAMFFSGIRGIRINLEKLLVIMLGPIITLSVLALISTVGNLSDIHWGASSVGENYTSGGFGPNQVSLVLGFGMVIVAILSLTPNKSTLYKWMCICLLIVLATQSGITWSRGGLYGGIIGVSIIFLYNMKNRNMMIGLSFFLIILFISLNYLFNYINQFTQGAFSARIFDLSTSGRGEMFIADLIVFLENPFLGVGVGESTYFHDIAGWKFKSGSHSFFPRLLAEHGLLGLIALLILIFSIFSSLFYKTSSSQKAIIVSFLVWAVFSMSHNDIRLSLPAFIFSFVEYLKYNVKKFPKGRTV